MLVFLTIYVAGVGNSSIINDVVGNISVTQGITGSGLLDRTASTGTMKFRLRNVNNVYTPTHVNCMTGFQIGASIWVTLGGAGGVC